MKRAKADVAIVGAGPGGATAAHRLAVAGATVIVLDPSHPREKPCGGGISARARGMFPELEALVSLGKTGTALRLVSPAGRMTKVEGGGRTFAVDRQILDSALFQRAVDAGAIHFSEKVTGLEKKGGSWRVQTPDAEVLADQLIGADGVRSIVRRTLIGKIEKPHLALGAHVLVPDLNPPTALIRFFGDRRGFAWVFNRKSQSSIGIGMPVTQKTDWRQTLLAFAAEQASGRTLPKIQSCFLPQPSSARAFSKKIAGDNWCLVGDAAGHVDPLTGEGILYAMWGGQLAAQAALSGRLEGFERLWREAFLERLLKRVRLAGVMEHSWVMEALLAAGRLPGIGQKLYGAINADRT